MSGSALSSDDHTSLVEARAVVGGLQNMLCNMPDEPMSFLQPFELMMLIQPVAEKLDKVLQEDEPKKA